MNGAEVARRFSYKESSMNVLIVDDELNIRKTLAMCLEAEGHQIVAVSNEKDALVEVGRLKFDMVFLDLRLGTVSGIDVIPKLLEKSPWLKIILITAHASIDTAVEAIRRGAFDYIAKPFSTLQVYAATKKVSEVRALENRVLQLENEISSNDDSVLTTHSPAMQHAIELAKDAAPTDASILITGENGTGKGVLARAIHRLSTRAQKPFGTVSCPSLSVELLESELFGHVKGAFTGAIRHNPGRIAACEGGTIFLDEIGDLPLGLQAKLLRFLQDHEYESVGDSVTKHADVRVIAATNVNLKEAVKAKTFREDLFYRLNVIRIELPSLRQRPQDILLLAEYFLSQFRKEKPLLGFSEEALNVLRHHKWPGNIRELRNVVERAVILSHGQWIEPKHLTLDEAIESQASDEQDLVSIEALEEKHIRRVLAMTRSMEEAAGILGIDTVTLWRKRKKFGI